MDTTLLVTVAACAALVAALVVVLVVQLVRTGAARRRLDAELASCRDDLAALHRRLDGLAAGPASGPEPGPASAEVRAPGYTITSMAGGTADAGAARSPAAEASEVAAAPSVTGGRVLSVAVGESVVRLLSLGHGVRRALSAENRNRIRFEVRREVRRARRSRRDELKDVRRRLRAQRAGTAEDAA